MKNPLRFASLTVLGLQSARRNLSVAFVLAGVVAVTSFGLAAAPRVVNQASDDALAIAAEAASSAQRNVSFNRLGRIAAAGPDDPFGRVVEQGDDLAASLDGELGAAIGDTTFAITSPAFVVGPFPVEAADPYRYFWFRYQEDAWDEAVVVEGRLPAASGSCRALREVPRASGKAPAGRGSFPKFRMRETRRTRSDRGSTASSSLAAVLLIEIL